MVPTCPFCGKVMVLRRSTHGEFYGCSGYPTCRGTRKVDEKVDEGEIGKTMREQKDEWDKENELDW